MNSTQSSGPHKGRKVRDMFSNHFNALRGRLIGTLFASILVVGLVACGGGGGSSTPPVVKTVSLAGTIAFVSKAGTPVALDAITPSDEPVVLCNAEGAPCAASAVMTCTGQSQAGVPKNVSATSVQFGHTTDFTLGACTISVTGTATGFTSATKDFTFTVIAAKKVPVASATTLAFDAGYIPQVSHLYADGTFETVTPVNKTGLALGVCVIGREVRPVSQPLNCGDAAGTRHNLSWNKSKMEIVAYDGTSGALPAITDSAFWLDVSDPDLVNGWNKAYTTSSGSVYTKSDRRFLNFQPKSTTQEVLMSGDLGNIKALTGF